MQDAFAYVLFGTVIVGVLAALVTFVLSGDPYDQIGRGGFYTDDDDGRRPPAPGGAADLAERDAEIRQMLTARNARRTEAGLEVEDVEAELARLVAPSVDAALRGEIREHVVAHNARRMRRGQDPVDVETEVERQVRDLGGGGA
ncbi:MAG: hypothetical protein ACR2NB_11380 [Solirubrobacteraceae bacterium]